MKVLRTLNGVTACKGRAKGAPIVARTPEDLDRVHDGDILVAMETDISFVPAMIRASAIITETGGRWCHAAVWARENKKPTIIQVPGATQMLNGIDLIAVNADAALVEWEE